VGATWPCPVDANAQARADGLDRVLLAVQHAVVLGANREQDHVREAAVGVRVGVVGVGEVDGDEDRRWGRLELAGLEGKPWHGSRRLLDLVAKGSVAAAKHLDAVGFCAQQLLKRADVGSGEAVDLCHTELGQLDEHAGVVLPELGTKALAHGRRVELRGKVVLVAFHQAAGHAHSDLQGLLRLGLQRERVDLALPQEGLDEDADLVGDRLDEALDGETDRSCLVLVERVEDFCPPPTISFFLNLGREGEGNATLVAWLEPVLGKLGGAGHNVELRTHPQINK